MVWLFVSQFFICGALLSVVLWVRRIAKAQTEVIGKTLRLFQEQNTFNALIVEAVKPKEKK